MIATTSGKVTTSCISPTVVSESAIPDWLKKIRPATPMISHGHDEHRAVEAGEHAAAREAQPGQPPGGQRAEHERADRHQRGDQRAS